LLAVRFRAFPLAPPDELRLRDDADEERRLDALDLPLALLALVVDRGLLFDVLRLFEAFEPFEL
jgi:hypothetical protein